MEAITLIVAHHSQSRFTRGWRLIVLLVAVFTIGTVNRSIFWFMIFLATGVWTVRAELVRRRQQHEEPDSGEPTRLRCFGNRDELDLLRNLEPRFFEPFVVQSSSFAQPGGLLLTPVGQKIFPLVTVIVLFVVLKWSGFEIAWIYGFFCLLYLAALFITYLAVPIYYRISPGYLELLVSRVFSNDLFLKRRIPLGDARIRCQFGGEVLIQPPGRETEKIFLTDFSREDENEFIQKLFTAAISPHKTPKLPVRELTG